MFPSRPVQPRPHLEYEDHVGLARAEPDLTEGQVRQSQTLSGAVVVVSGLQTVPRTWVIITLHILHLKLSD